MPNVTAPSKPTIDSILTSRTPYVNLLGYLEQVRKDQGESVAYQESFEIMTDLVRALIALNDSAVTAENIESIRRCADRIRTF